MPESNRMARLLAKLDILPQSLRGSARSLLLGQAIPFVGTAKLFIEEVTPERVVIHLRNRRRVQNHIKGIHAAAMALLAETATGFALGMHLPDGRIPLIKTLHIDYVKRAHGDLRAVVELGAADIETIRSREKGELAVPVIVTDDSGASPIVCEAIWAWIPARRDVAAS